MNKLTKFKFGLIGWPVGHSFSPALHAAALESCGLKGEYTLFPICPSSGENRALADVIQQVRQGSLHGINVTIPHKQSVIPLLDRLTLAAQEIGAVNTIYVKNGYLIGDNTDAQGFLLDLKNKMLRQPVQKAALVLGAGGSSRAVTYTLSRAGWHVIVAARRLTQAQVLVNNLSSGQNFDITACCLSPDDLLGLQPALIVNTTPVGMSPNISNSPWAFDIPFPQDCFIYDLIYNPKETLLVQQAKSSGLEASGGLGMLVEQAALSFEIWTGYSASRLAIVEAVEKHTKNAISDMEETHGP